MAHGLVRAPAEHLLSRRIPHRLHVSVQIQTNDRRRCGLNDGPEQVVRPLQFSLGQFALGDIPGQVGQERHGLDVICSIIHRFVAHTEDRHEPVASKNRHDQLADDIRMPGGHALAVW